MCAIAQTTRRISFALGLMVLGVAAAAQQTSLYFLAATPAPEGWRVPSYPVRLYKAKGVKLEVLRQIVGRGEGFAAVASDLHGDFYIVGQSVLTVVHEANPGLIDEVHQPSPADSVFWGIAGDHLPPSVAILATTGLRRISGDPASRENPAPPLECGDLKLLQFGGANGGPYPALPPIGQIDHGYIAFPTCWSAKVEPLPPEVKKNPSAFRTIPILAADDRYLVEWPYPDSLAASSASIVEPTTRLDILEKQSGHWQSVAFDSAVTDERLPETKLFGNWLVVMVMLPNPGQSLGDGAGRANQRVGSGADSDLPPIYSGYSDWFRGLFLPGKFILQNLSRSQTVLLRTGQEDSEVLAIRPDGEMLYRVNDAIYETRIEGDKLAPATLVVKDTDVPEIHWAFWSSAQPPAVRPAKKGK